MNNTILSTWSSVAKFLSGASEQQAYELLQEELAGRRRSTVLLRLYGKYNKLRTQRERLELIQKSLS